MGCSDSFCIMGKFRLDANEYSRWVGNYLKKTQEERMDGHELEIPYSLMAEDLCVRVWYLVHQLRKLRAETMHMF